MTSDVTGRHRPKPVLDASLAIGLAKIGKFDLIQQLFGKVAVAKAVLREVQAKGGLPGAPEIKEAIDAGWAEVVAVETDRSFSSLGAGEAATLTYARKTGAVAVLDDKVGRSHALRHQLQVLGTAGVLLAAKRKGLVDRIAPLLDELRRRGFHLSDKVVRDALAAAGEQPCSDKSG